MSDTTAKADDTVQTTASANARAETATKEAGETAQPTTEQSGSKQASVSKPDGATKQDVAVIAKSEKANSAQVESATQAAPAEVMSGEDSSIKLSSAEMKSDVQNIASSTASTATPETQKPTDAPITDVGAETEGLVAKKSEAVATSAPVAATPTTTATGTAKATESTNATEPENQPIPAAEWRVITETVPGASHLRNGIPNQDSVLHLRQSSVGLPIIAAVADGHGSNKCFRSDRGSRYAVRIGAELLDKVVTSEFGKFDAAELEQALRERLPAEFVRRWRAEVEDDLERDPLREEEFARLVAKDGERARRLVESNTYLAYGSTTLHVLLTDTYALYLQLGDGEMLNVAKSGEVTLPLPEDSRLLANETTSLCLDHAAEDFRMVIRPHNGESPAMIFMTTDGYYNSFATSEGFQQVCSDVLQMLREEDGFGTVNRALKGWLEEATQAGSGDDCSVALIINMDLLKKPTAQSDASKT